MSQTISTSGSKLVLTLFPPNPEVVGQTVLFVLRTTGVNGCPVDATGPSLVAKRPDGTTVELDPSFFVKEGINVWKANGLLDQIGKWEFNARVTTPVTSEALAWANVLQGIPGGSAPWLGWVSAAENAAAAAASAAAALASEIDAETAAAEATAARDQVVPLAAQVTADAAATAADRVQTGLNATSTAEDAATAEAAAALASQAVSSVANAVVNRDTLAQLQLVTGSPQWTLGAVNDDGANNGSYSWSGVAWVMTNTATIASLDQRATVTEGNIHKASKYSPATIAWAIRFANRVVPLAVDTLGQTVVWALRVVPGLRKWRFAGIIPLIVHQSPTKPWAALWAQKSDGTIDMIPSESLKRRLGSSLPAPTHLFAGGAVVNAPNLQALSSSVEGWNERYKFRTDIATPAVAVAQSADRAVHLPQSGQSNAVAGGSTDFPPGQRSVTIVPPYPHRGLEFIGGPIHTSLSVIDPATITDLAPAVETSFGESNISSCLRWMINKDVAADVLPPVYIGETHGVAGQRLDAITKGTGPYENGLMLARKAREYALTYGLSGTWIPGHILDQGEANRNDPRSQWLAEVLSYRGFMEPDLRDITRQSEPIWMTIAQLATAPGNTITAQTALPQQDAMLTGPRITLSMPSYFFQGSVYGMSGVHFCPAGHALRGEYHAKALRIIRRQTEAAIERGDDPWALTIAEVRTCLRPDYAAISRVGAVITIPLILPEGSTAVVLDVATLPAAPNFGWNKTAGSGGAITNVAIVGNSVQITLASAGGATLRYAYDPPGTVTVDRSGAWGNIRDNCEEDSIAVPGLKLRNWLIICDFTVG